MIPPRIANYFRSYHCIDISKYDETFLWKSLQKRMEANNLLSVEEYYTLLEVSKEEGKYFLAALQIGYSSFFRNPLTFAVLERLIFPEIVFNKVNSKRKEIRIWSAACAAGQEVYSIAILLEELNRGIADPFRYRIFATDYSESLIHDALKGEYSAYALNNLGLKRVGEWFLKQGEIYTVKPELKTNIEFSHFDLLDEHLSCPSTSIFGDFDLVFCANLLFYYTKDCQQKILEKLLNCLSSRGYLITGEAEREIIMDRGDHEAYPFSAIFNIGEVRRQI